MKSVRTPWGSYSNLYMAASCRVKELIVLPGHRTSLQYHRNRAEILVCVDGQGTIIMDKRILSFQYGQTVVIPMGIPHRIECKGDSTLKIIETWIGDKFDEADIVRIEDDYGREKC